MKTRMMLAAAVAAICSGISQAQLPGIYFQVSNAGAETQRRCWTYDKSMITIAFKNQDTLRITAKAGSCDVKRDPSYPNSHVPKQYQSWFRYFEDAKTDESTNWGKDNPCSKAFGMTFSDGDIFGVFEELRLDSGLLDSTFKGSASLQVTVHGLVPMKYICR